MNDVFLISKKHLKEHYHSTAIMLFIICNTYTAVYKIPCFDKKPPIVNILVERPLLEIRNIDIGNY